MDRAAFREALLQVMERKDHWAWPGFTGGLVPADRLHLHLEQEYATYIRDFPILIGRAYVQCPIAEVRRELIENAYEEETGGLAAGRPHPELFLEIPAGLGMDLDRFAHVELIPAAAAYRAFLDETTQERGWAVAACVSTLFIEGTRYERGELDETADKRPTPALEDHPLVKHYGLDPERLKLTRAHRAVEGEHRAAAWRVLLDHVAENQRPHCVAAIEGALEHWLRYRDAVARACGLEEGPEGPRRAA